VAADFATKEHVMAIKKTHTKKSKRTTKAAAASKAVSRAATAQPAPSAVLVEADIEPDLPEEIGPADLTSAERQFLGRTARFLIGIQSPRHLRRAARVGYGPEDHQEGWDTWGTAAGRKCPLSHMFAEVAIDMSATGEVQAKLRTLDEFENMWFPRTRAMIPRLVPAATRDAFAAAFFRNLQQQPLSPLVVDSVATFLERVEALETSPEPGAARLFASLVKRGLGKRKRDEMHGLVAELRSAATPPAPPKEVRDVLQAREAQQAALADLRLWWNDWSVTLRPLFDAREQIILGLAEMHITARSTDAVAPVGEPPANG
jgi:hypothetical protein